MTIKIPYQWSWTSSSFKHNYIKNIRRLMVEENEQWVEKYRLVISVGRQREQLVYAKGKIKLNYNDKYKDSNGVEHKITSFNGNDEIFAFYEDGFYKKDSLGLSREDYFCLNSSWNNNNSLESMFSLLNVRGNRRHFTENKIYHDYGYERPILPLSKGGIVFIGWYTDPTGGKKIDSVQDLLNYTDLFGYKDNDSLPEITLYAHWKIPTFTLRINNIKRRGVSSSFQFYDTKNKKWTTINSSYAKLDGLIYGTNISLFLKNNVRKVTYTSWAQKDFKKVSSQKFLGWGMIDPVNTKVWYNPMDIDGYYQSSFWAYALQVLQESGRYWYFDSNKIWDHNKIPQNISGNDNWRGWEGTYDSVWTGVPIHVLDWSKKQNKPYGYRDEEMFNWIYNLQELAHQYCFGFMTKDWTIYPHFKPLVIWEGAKIENKVIKTKIHSPSEKDHAGNDCSCFDSSQYTIEDKYAPKGVPFNFYWKIKQNDNIGNKGLWPYSSTTIFHIKKYR